MTEDISRLRVPHDFYATPPEGTRALLSVERFSGSIWEPACGNGAISKVLIATGYTVTSTDLVHRGYGIGGINFLTETKTRGINIVTNPPYGHGLADVFIGHALKMVAPVNGSVAMLLNLAGLAHPLRHKIWTRHPPAAVYILDELTCWPNGIEHGFAAEHRYCWAVWKPGHVGRPALWWLSTT